MTHAYVSTGPIVRRFDAWGARKPHCAQKTKIFEFLISLFARAASNRRKRIYGRRLELLMAGGDSCAPDVELAHD
jgi:hypothetical protein